MRDRPHGSVAPGPTTPVMDRRITDLVLEAMTAAPLGRPGRHTADPFRVGAATAQSLERSTPLIMGTVVHAVPHLNWYKVQTFEAGFLGCCLLRQTGASPVGVRAGSPVPPNSCVLVYKPPHLNYGVILGVLPPLAQTNALSRPDYLVQGGGAGLYAEPAHQQPIRGTLRGGGVLDFSCGSPLDATSLEYSLVTELGIAFLMDPFQAYLRVNEHCGLFLNWFDSYAKLIGYTLDLASAVHEEAYKNDEGEHTFFRGVSVYPWEAMGNFAPGGGADHDEFGAQEVQSGAPVATYDLARDRLGTRPFHRYREYGGYLGQGGMRLVCAPPGATGFNAGNDPVGGLAAPGLFCESVGLDGSYLLRSAKSITLVKRCNVPVPRPTNEQESSGGDSAGGDYRFSGHFGEGDAHRVGDLAAGDQPGLLKVAGVQEFLAHACNWKALHPFHYHQGDFAVPQEADASNGEGDAVAEVPDYAELETASRLADPVAFRLRIDHRYGQVDYFRRESFFHMGDDGAVVLGCGWGARIALTGGKLRLEAPGDLEIVAGGRVVSLSRDLIVQAANSADVSAGRDLRLSAAANLQASGGGVLVEATRAGRDYDYENLIGEDVVASGIVFRSAGDLSLLGEDLYLRSGVSGDGSDGGITLDAARRDGVVRVESSRLEAATQGGVFFSHGNADQEPTHVHVFGPGSTVLSSVVFARGGLRVVEGPLTVDGALLVSGDASVGGRVADREGGMVGRLPDVARQRLREAAADDVAFVEAALEAGAEIAESVEDDWRSAGLPGSDDLLRDMHFSFRDDDDGRQYGAGDLAFLEPRWQQMARLAGQTAGRAWPEVSVPYQGRTLYPWPGRRAWTSLPTFLRAGTPALYDPTTGNAATRGDATYGAAAYAAPERVPLADGLRTVF